jgi:5-(carboxyamino)imidazole ribonucleotide mutase
MATPVVGIIMGSTSDWDTMQHCAQTLDGLGVGYEKRVISAHRTPQLMHEWTTTAESRGLKVVIAAAGGAAHLAGVAAALTALPVLGVPMESASLKGLDSLLSRSRERSRTLTSESGSPALIATPRASLAARRG